MGIDSPLALSEHAGQLLLLSSNFLALTDIDFRPHMQQSVSNLFVFTIDLILNVLHEMLIATFGHLFRGLFGGLRVAKLRFAIAYPRSIQDRVLSGLSE